MKREKKVLAAALSSLLVLTYCAEGYAFVAKHLLPPLFACIHVFLFLLGLVAVGFYPAYAFRLLYLRMGGVIDKRGERTTVGGRIFSFLIFLLVSFIWVVVLPVLFGALIVSIVVFSRLLPLEAAAFILPPVGILFITMVDIEQKMRLTFKP